MSTGIYKIDSCRFTWNVRSNLCQGNNGTQGTNISTFSTRVGPRHRHEQKVGFSKDEILIIGNMLDVVLQFDTGMPSTLELSNYNYYKF